MKESLFKKYAIFKYLPVTAFLFIMFLAFIQGTEADAKEAAAKYSFDVSSKILYTGWKSYYAEIIGADENATITFKSKNKKVATVSEDGEIFPVSPGKTTIYATIKIPKQKKKTCSMKVTVKEPYSKLSASTTTMTLDGSYVFDLERYGHDKPVSWELSYGAPVEIEAVSATGCKVHPLKAGSFSLVARCGDETFSTDIKIYDGKGPLFILSPDSKPYKDNYTTYSTYNKYTKGYYLLRSYLEKLDATKGGVLVLQKGTYTVTNTLCIPSNTTIVLEDGARIVKSDNTNSSLNATASLFQTVSYTNAAKEGVFKGYNGEHDIKILGEGDAQIDLNGIKSHGIVACHCNRLTVSGIKFLNMNTYHFIELDASKDVIISNNYFSGSAESTTARKEAINLDTPDTVTNGFHQYWTSYDKTPDLNVYITDNIFYDLECAVGTHKYTYGSPHKNVNFLRNTVIDCSTYAVRCMNWDKPVITDNVFINTVFPEFSHIFIILNGATNPLITNNLFENTITPVSFYHWRNTGYGKEYDPIYNTLDASYAKALTKNYLKDVENGYYEFYTVLDNFDEETLETYPINGYLNM